MKIEVCAGSKCTVAGGDIILSVLERFKEELILEYPKLEDKIEIIPVACDGFCHARDNVAPIVRINGQIFERARSQDIMAYIMDFYKL